ncbi:hypothetical protein ES703_04304 [subsurface metagenome]
MDKFAIITGIVGVVLLLIALLIFISVIVRMAKRKMKIKRFFSSFIIFLIITAFSISFIYLSLFLQTFSRYTHEERLGMIHAEKPDETINIYFFDEKRNKEYNFVLSGDQWMVEGCILRWSVHLRWLGADTYYKVTRFRGRWEKAEGKSTTEYEIKPQGRLWKFLLLYGESIPFVDTAYGIGAFQYPNKETYNLYINDTGFILRKRNK